MLTFFGGASEDAENGIARKRKKWTVFKQFFGCGMADEEIVMPLPVRVEKTKGEEEGVVR